MTGHFFGRRSGRATAGMVTWKVLIGTPVAYAREHRAAGKWAGLLRTRLAILVRTRCRHSRCFPTGDWKSFGPRRCGRCRCFSCQRSEYDSKAAGFCGTKPDQGRLWKAGMLTGTFGTNCGSKPNTGSGLFAVATLTGTGSDFGCRAGRFFWACWSDLRAR